MIVFENRGEIDITAMTTFGVSVKVGDNPIGFFGTGLKYAIAVLLRTGHRVTAFSGEDQMRFSTRLGNVRGKDFEFVEMALNDAVPATIGFTTELGKTWEPWMAYRELYCNTRDEGGEVYLAANAGAIADPRRELTQIRVEGDAIEEVHADHAQYFLDGEPDLTCNGVGIYRRPSSALFYRGVRVLRLPRPAVFTYNLLERVELTEDRTMAHPFMATYYLTRALAKCEEPEFLEAALTASGGSLEREFDYQNCVDKHTETFLTTVGRLNNVGGLDLAPAAVKVWNAARPRSFIPIGARLSRSQEDAFTGARARSQQLNIGTAPMTIVEAVPDGGKAIIVDGHIYLDQSLVDNKQALLRVIIEQQAEVASHDDPLREPIDFLLDALVAMVEETP